MKNFRKQSSYLALQLSLALGIFVAVATGIFVLRSKPERSFSMPYLINKNFIDVYDDLQRLGLRIKISRRSYKDLPIGLILSQSLTAGEIVQSNAYLALTINQPHPFLSMPNLLQSNLESALAVIKRIPENGRVYALEIGAISKLVTDKYPHNTIIAQFPPPKDTLNLNARVYLLVALRPSAKAEEVSESSLLPIFTSKKMDNQKWVGQNIGVASQYFYHRKIDYRIRHVKAPPHADKNGQIYAIKKVKPKTTKKKHKNTFALPKYLLDVYYQKPETRYYSGYERVKIEFDEEGACFVRSIDLKNRIKQQVIFATQAHQEDEEVDILFYRQGAIELEGVCGSDKVYDRKFYPETLG